MALESIYFPSWLVTFAIFDFSPKRTTDHANWKVSLNFQVILIQILPNHIFPACMNGIFAQVLIATYG